MAVVGTGVVVASGGWDLTKPLSDYFPPPVAMDPDTAESGELALKATGPSLEDQIMELTNQERWNNGQLPPYKRNHLLDSSAAGHSQGMGARNFFSHVDPDDGCSLPWDRISDAGYDWNYAGENVAAGNSTAAATMAQWMGSPGHRAQILSTDSRELGIGYYHDASDTNYIRYDGNADCVAESTNNGPWYHYWTQNFGKRNNVYPVVINREAYQTATRNVSLYIYGSNWASEMRIRNENGTWTDWQSFATNKAWVLSPGSGTKQVFVETRSGGTVRSASDTIVSTDDTATDEIFGDGFESNSTSAWSDTVPSQ